MKRPIISVIKLYQSNASQRIRGCCRFEPSCSNYMIKSVEKHGTIVGTMKGIKRFLRCRPPYGGIDKP